MAGSRFIVGPHLLPRGQVCHMLADRRQQLVIFHVPQRPVPGACREESQVGEQLAETHVGRQLAEPLELAKDLLPDRGHHGSRSPTFAWLRKRLPTPFPPLFRLFSTLSPLPVAVRPEDLRRPLS